MKQAPQRSLGIEKRLHVGARASEGIHREGVDAGGSHGVGGARFGRAIRGHAPHGVQIYPERVGHLPHPVERHGSIA